jgi:hypothetical protein
VDAGGVRMESTGQTKRTDQRAEQKKSTDTQNDDPLIIRLPWSRPTRRRMQNRDTSFNTGPGFDGSIVHS